MKNILKFLADRLKEPSSMRGLVMILTSLGVGINPDLVAPIIAVGTGVAGIIGVATSEKKK